MKDCKKIHPLLALYIENELTAREKAAVENHVSRCAEAREELKQWERLGKALKSMPEPPMPHNLHDKIMARLHGKPLALTPNPFRFRASWGLAAAAGLAFIFSIQNFGWLGNQNSQVALKPSSPVSFTGSGASANRPLGTDMALKPQTKSLANQQMAMVAPQKEKVLEEKKAEIMSAGNVDLALQPPAPTTAPAMVLAMGPVPQARKKAMVKNRSFSNNTDASFDVAAAPPQPALAMGQMEATNGNTTNTSTDGQALTSLSDIHSVTGGAPSSQNTKPQFLRFDTIQIGLLKYQLNWQTDLVTKGQLFILDSTGNTLQADAENTQFAYDHRMIIDASKINTEFFIKILVNDQNGNEAVTFSNILNHQ